MKTKQDVIEWLDKNTPRFTEISDDIWAHPELAHHEFYSSRRQAEFLAGEGFRITWEIAGLRTAFLAEWGSGKPILGFAGEYDALKGLSQKNQPTREPVVEGAPGHGCGHNLLGTGIMAAAVALKQWLEATHTSGTVRYYGCPAEENTYGKAFMARAGVFDDLDAAFTYHPSYINFPGKGSMVGVDDLKFHFYGKTAHAGGSPHLGRSALDAVELMNVGVNYLREHVSEKTRIHYVITKGGDAPNIVPGEAEVWYFIRSPQPDEMEDVLNRVRAIAQGAAMMTETRYEETFRSACAPMLNNHVLADLHYEAMKLVGPIQFSEEEKAYARKINEAFPRENVESLFKRYRLPLALKSEPLIGDIFPALDENKIETVSSDVGDLSRKTPVSMLGSACLATAVPGHSWGVVATGATSIGHKGMMWAAKVMALAALECCLDPKHLLAVRQEFEENTRDHPYQPLPDSVQPPRYEPGS